MDPINLSHRDNQYYFQNTPVFAKPVSDIQYISGPIGMVRKLIKTYIGALNSTESENINAFSIVNKERGGNLVKFSVQPLSLEQKLYEELLEMKLQSRNRLSK